MAEYTDEQRRFVKALHNSTSGDYEHYSPLVEPFIQDGWCIGTDGHHLLRIKQELIPDNEILYNSTMKMPNVQNVLPTELNIREKITSENVKAALDKVPLTNEVECEDCHGNGTVKFVYNAVDGCGYEIEDDCPVCGGCGQVKLETPVMDESYPMKIKDLLVTSRQILWLARIMRIMQLKEIELRSVTDRAYFMRDLDIDMLIMGAFLNDKKEIQENPPIVLI